MDDYIEAHYGDLNDKRRRTPTPWALKDGSGARVRPATVSGRYFADLDQSFAVARELAASAPPEGVAPPAACAKARAAAKVMAARYPKDLDYRRFSGAVEVRCGSPRAAFDALLPDTRDPGFVRRDGLQATALALLAGARSDAATIFRSTFNADWTLATEAEIARDKARFDRQTTITGAFGAAIGAQVGVGSVRPEMLRRYNTLPCTLDSTELKQTYEGICNELFGGTSAAFTCKPDTYIIDIRTSRLAGRNIYNCPTGRLGDRALSIGPLEYLREESPWYRAVAGVATWEERLARAEQEQKAAQAARKGN